MSKIKKTIPEKTCLPFKGLLTSGKYYKCIKNWPEVAIVGNLYKAINDHHLKGERDFIYPWYEDDKYTFDRYYKEATKEEVKQWLYRMILDNFVKDLKLDLYPSLEHIVVKYYSLGVKDTINELSANL